MSKHWDSGFTVFSNSLICDKNLDCFDKIIFLLILSYHYRDENYMSLSYISKCTNISKNKVSKSLKSLLKHGMIKKVKEHTVNSPACYEATHRINIVSKTEIGEHSADRGVYRQKAQGVPPESTGGVPPESTKEIIIKRNNNKLKERDNFACNESKSETDNVVSEPFDYLNNKSQEVIKHWNNQEHLKECKLNHRIMQKLGMFLAKLEDDGYDHEDIKKAAINYSRVLSNRNSWRKNNCSLMAFFGLNGRKPQYEQFLDDYFDMTDYVNNKDDIEETLLEKYIRYGMSKEEAQNAINQLEKK